MEKPTLIFITGGARSGKSTFAEHYASILAKGSGRNLHYIATSKPTDDEMSRRIFLHQKGRQENEIPWKTWECPIDLVNIAEHFQKTDIVLLDCLTLLLTNELFREEFADHLWDCEETQQTIIETILNGIFSILNNCHTLFIVSNEVLHEQFKNQSLVQTYGKLLGFLHQQIVNQATEAYLVEAGIPVMMKGCEMK